MFTAQVSHYENLTALHKLISIVLQLANQIKQKFPAKSCGARAKFLNCSGDEVEIKMIISSSSSYLFFYWPCFNVSLFRQCSIVVLRCSILRCFHRSEGVPLFLWCSVIPALFRRSAGVPCSGVPGFIVCPS